MVGERPSAWETAAVALASFCAVLLGLVLHRVYAFVYAPPFAYLGILIAAAGWPLGAVVVSSYSGWTDAGTGPRRRLAAAACLPPAVAGALLAALYLPANPGADAAVWALWGIVAAAGAAPMFVLGAATASLVAARRGGLPVLAAAGLGGAAAAVVAYGPLLSVADGPTAVLGIGAPGALMALCVAAGGRRRKAAVVCGVLASLWALLAALNGTTPILRPQWVRGARAPAAQRERWSPLGVARARYVAGPPERIEIGHDSGRVVEVLPFAGSLEPPAFLDHELPHAAYRLRPGGDVCVVGAGGGREVLSALRAGARRIVAIEPDPWIADLVARELGDFGGWFVEQPAVEWVVDEPRAWLREREDRFDVIQVVLPFPDPSPVPDAFGPLASRLMTVEAVGEFLRHLRPDGILAITVEYETDFPHAATRAYGLARGAAQGADCVVAIQGPLYGRAGPGLGALCVLVRPRDWTREEDAQARALGAGRPGRDLSKVPTDDRPYFFYFLPWPQLLGGGPMANDRYGNYEIARNVLRACVLGALVLGTALGLPLAARRVRIGPAAAVHFAAAGAAFALLALGSVQRWGAALGHPLYASPLVGVGLLAFAGVGALAGARLGRFRGSLPAAGILTAVLAFGLWLGVSRLAPAVEGLGLAARMLAGLAVSGVPACGAGLVWGLGGVRWRLEPPAFAWCVGVGAAAAVLASCAAGLVFVYLGYSAALGIAAAGYGVASLASLSSARS